MADVTIDTSTSAAAAAVSSLTYSLTVASNSARGLHVGVGVFQGVTPRTVTGITYNSVALSQDWHVSTGSFGLLNDGWSLIAPDTGTHNVIVTLSGSVSELLSGAISLYHCNQTTLTYDPQTNTESGVGSNAVTVSPTDDGDLVISAVVVNDVGEIDTYDGTQQYLQEPLSTAFAGFSQVATPPTTTQTIVFFGTPDSILGAVVFKHESPTYEFLAASGLVEIVGASVAFSLTPNMKYSVNGQDIVFAEGNEPQPGDILIVDYRYEA